MCRLQKMHNDVTQGNWAKVWRTKTTYWYIVVWATQMPNNNTNNTSMNE